MLDAVRDQAEGVRFLRRVVEGKLTSPLLLIGTEGTGRRFAVTQAAKEAFSKGDPESIHSIQIDKGAHPDVLIIEPPEQKEIGVETIREVINQARFMPSLASQRYIIIDGADTITVPAANALLKVLEEPPRTTRFFLLAESNEVVLPTVRSRCGLVRFGPVSEPVIVEHLRVHTDDATKPLVYARLSEGSVGRAIQFLGAGRLALRDTMVGLLKKGLTGDLSSLFEAVNQVSGLKLGLRFFEHVLHDLVMLPHDPTRLTNLDIADELGGLRDKLGGRVDRLIEGLRGVQQSQRASGINLGFHVKAYLANVFTE